MAAAFFAVQMMQRNARRDFERREREAEASRRRREQQRRRLGLYDTQPFEPSTDNGASP